LKHSLGEQGVIVAAHQVGRFVERYRDQLLSRQFG
jgi:hypothetical protein